MVFVNNRGRVIRNKESFAALRFFVFFMDVAVLVTDLFQILLVLLLVLNFPVEQESQRAAQHDDRTQDPQLLPLPHDHRAQDLAAHLEAQRKCDALREFQTDVLLLSYPFDKAADRRVGKDDNAEQFQQEDPPLDQKIEYTLGMFYRSSHTKAPLFLFIPRYHHPHRFVKTFPALDTLLPRRVY